MPDELSVITETHVESSAGRLNCIVATPPGPVSARLLIVHGYGEHAGRYIHFMQWLAERGVASEAIDLRGHGRSPGRRGFVVRWDEYIDDLKAFLDRDREHIDGNRSTGAPPVFSEADNAVNPHVPSEADDTGGTTVLQKVKDAQPPLFVMGHSHGGLIVAIAGESDIFQTRGVRGCVIASPYLATRLVTPWHKRFVGRIANRLMPHLRVATGLRPQWLTDDESMRREDLADPLMNRSATPRWYFTTLGMQAQAIADAPAFTLPMLCIIGADDVVADPATAAEFFRRAGSKDKSHYVYPTTAHELFRDKSREVVFTDVLRWLNVRSQTSLPVPSPGNPGEGLFQLRQQTRGRTLGR
jgi:alpha-beta hydrolase superfamily lysophospholipase